MKNEVITPVTLAELLGPVEDEVVTYDDLMHEHEAALQHDYDLAEDINEYLEG